MPPCSAYTVRLCDENWNGHLAIVQVAKCKSRLLYLAGQLNEPQKQALTSRLHRIAGGRTHPGDIKSDERPGDVRSIPRVRYTPFPKHLCREDVEPGALFSPCIFGQARLKTEVRQHFLSTPTLLRGHLG
jgi:hypothetical protein